ncbi:MAG: Eco57I restriction-modification methylase domain-containing protein [Candidatus Coproplasma sp.]
MTVYNTSSYKLIYIFSIPDEAHKGLVKVGEATIHTVLPLDSLTPNCSVLREAADKGRIKDYTFTAGIKINLIWAELAIRTKEDFLNGSKVTTIQGFRDHDVHNVLKNSGIKTVFPNGIKNKEWFECDAETAKNAIKAVIAGRAFLSEKDKNSPTPIPAIKLRDEQRAAVDRTLSVFSKGDTMLWNCKMRFGKTLTAYELIRSGNYQKTIVVTHRPVVEAGWEEDHAKLFGAQSSHIFMKKQNLSYSEDYYDYNADVNNDTALRNAKAHGDHFTYFASMQDLRGSKRAGGKFDKNNAVFDMDWDLIIYDEAHEGTQTDLGQMVQSLLECEKNGKKPKVLELSGTPYNIMDKYDDNVYTWDYVMEQKAKEEWANKHPGEPNPYADMPKMNIFTFDMSEAIPTSYRYETETSAFNFREFFRVWTGDAEKDYRPVPEGAKIGDFVHEDDVISFLNLISTESEDTKYPFATDEFRKEFKHTFWMVPGVKEAKALSSILKRHPVFMHYQVVNVAGEGDEELPYDNALKLVQDAIKENEYTITISCGKLTTGVTVREWTAVMMLAGSAKTEAKGYMQTIFRVQSAGQIDGKQKENCYVFDFAPDRALNVISDTHKLSTKSKVSDKKLKDQLILFMNYCPVIAISGTKMEPYNANSLMRQIKRISIDAAIKSGFEDDSIYKVDAGIVMDERDKEFFEALKARLNAHAKTKRETKVTLADNGLSDEDYKKAVAIEHKPAKNLTPEEIALKEKLKEQRKQQQAFFGLLRNISIRLPLLIYGADVPLTESLPLEKFTEIVDDESWKEFMPADVDKDLFKRSIKYFDEDVLMAAGLRIRRLAKQADEYPPTERVKRITDIIGYFRNPDKETVLTPWRVVNMHMSDTIGGYCFLNEQFDAKDPLEEPRLVSQGDVTEELFRTDSKILEINSKSGLYPLYVAYSLYRKRLTKKEEEYSLEEQTEIWNQVLKDNVFVLCKTKMAKAITQRTLTGFSGAKTNTRYLPHLLDNMQTDMERVVRKILNPHTWDKEGEKMKFDAVVGNPPYQISDGGAKASAMPVYNYFVESAKKCNPSYLSMIMPARWYAGGKGLDEFRNTMLNDNRTRLLVDFANSADCFSNVNIAGGVCYFLWDKDYSGKCHVININKNNTIPDIKRGLNDFPIFVRNNYAIRIIEKTVGTHLDNMNQFVKTYSFFAIRSYFAIPSYERGSQTKNAQNDVILISSQGKGFYSKEKVIDRDNIINKYKVIITYAMSGGNKPSNTGDYQIISSLKILNKNEVCTETYLVLGAFDNLCEATNLKQYMATKFSRFLLLQALTSIHITRDSFIFVPLQDFTENSDIDWSQPIPDIDRQLYKKYGLSDEEISFIESMVKPME